MSRKHGATGTGRSIPSRTVALFRQTGVVIRGALGRRDGKAIAGVSAAAYFVLLETLSTNLGIGDGSVGLLVVDDPLATGTRQIGPFQFEPIALVTLGPLEYLSSPLTAAIAVAVAVLVGVNLAVSWVVWRGPEACHVNPGVGALAGVPGLLSGFVCCGPTILLVVGVQASAGLVAALQWAPSVAVLLLVAWLLWVGRQVILKQ